MGVVFSGCGVCVFSGNGRFRTREGMRHRKFIWSGLIIGHFSGACTNTSS